ncbi:TetR family transcriptional regulator [Aeromicrobium sp. YIM 150415]|uniref:TetR/AcrR family transcriptional regulator n=1 Tax=Aeromicrobium sp. YIM 150415 TaxID=2803912 RepID=UPI001964DCB3|nr:TetR family transcriptional regulator [Aeromicrobium sp. YIM 150415]MBM9463513.1 TetR family transcriptional regulator [Aeromicrobium sp. YIM 150415]
MTGRRRGRPRSSESADRRAAILASARTAFAARGFQGTTVRAVAADAGVDPSLVAHYFGSKERLFVATMELPVDPAAKLAGVIAEGPEGLGERLVRTFVSSWDPHREVIAALLRGAVSGSEASPPVIEMAREVLVAAIHSALEGERRELRAELVAAQVIGLGMARYVAAFEPLASSPVEDVVAAYAPAVQSLIDG